MAEKKEEFRYGAAFLPDGEKKYSVIRWGWNGLNRTDKIDTGQLTDMSGMICDPPYMEPVKLAKEIIDFSTGIPIKGSGFIIPVAIAERHAGDPISITGNFTEDKIITMVWRDRDTSKITVSRYIYNEYDTPGTVYTHGWYCMGEYQLGDGGLADLTIPRTIVMFNAVDTSSGNIMQYEYDRKQLVYPDCYSIPVTYGGTAASFNTQANPIPVPKLATVFGSRVFGVTDEDLVTASAYNSYVDYSLDTADDVSSAHAWASMAGSSTDSDGSFTAICTYDNHVVLFKKDFMQLVYNNKNPFRIVDVGKFGCDNEKAWTILNNVLYFASASKVYAYTGGTPKEISAKLDAGDLSGAVLGSFKDTLWMQTKDGLYNYKKGVWSNVGTAPFGGAYVRVAQFATLDYGLAALVNLDPDGQTPVYTLYMVDWDTELMDLTDESAADWEAEYPTYWKFVTDLMALGKLDIRRVKKFSMLCEGQKGATVSVYLLRDGDVWIDRDRDKKLVGTLTLGNSSGIHMLRVLTRQFSATTHQLYFVGSGYMKIYAAELKISWGGDLYAES